MALPYRRIIVRYEVTESGKKEYRAYDDKSGDLVGAAKTRVGIERVIDSYLNYFRR